MRGLIEPWHLLVLLIVLLVLFGGKRLPEAARGLGRSMRIFKAEVKEMRDDDKPHETASEVGPLEGRVVGDQPAAPTSARDPEPARTSDQRRPGL